MANVLEKILREQYKICERMFKEASALMKYEDPDILFLKTYANFMHAAFVEKRI